MPRLHRHAPVDDLPLEPTWAPGDISLGDQRALLRELRDLSNSVAAAYRARDERLLALALSGSLSRRDMATATGLNKSRIDQIITEMAEAEHAARKVRAGEGNARHLPLGSTKQR